MAPMKRPAATGAAGAAKRSARDPISLKCSTVIKALHKAEDLPPNVREMLADMVPASLSVMSAERHPFQIKTVEMVGEVLSGMDSKMQLALAEAQSKVDGAEAEKSARVATHEAAQSSLTDAEAKSIAAREASQMDAAALHEAKAEAVSAHAAEAETKADLVAKAEQQTTLAAAVEVFETLRSTKLAGREGSKTFSTISSALEDICGAEASLVNALHQTLKKEVENRGSFDTVIEKNATDLFTSNAAELQKALSASEATKAAATAATTAAEAASAAATEKSAASAVAFEAAVAAMRSAEVAFSEAKDAVEDFDEEVKEAETTLAKAKESLAAFQEGPHAAFLELKSLAPPEEDNEVLPEQEA